MKLLVLLTVFVLKKEVFSHPGNSTSADVPERFRKNIIKEYKDFSYEDYHNYLSELLQKDTIAAEQELIFPMSLSSSNYTLTDGTVSRFYDPISYYGTFDKVIFHQLNKEFFGITQVYGPKIEFSFKYTTNFQGSKKNGSLKLVVSHVPLELQIDLGDLVDGKCKIDNSENDVFYFYDDKLTLIPTFSPGSDPAAGNDLVKQLSETWLGDFYRIIMKVKVEMIASDTKKKILQDEEFRKNLDHICISVQ